MIEIKNTEAARKLIRENRFVSIVWHKQDCPVCEHFLSDIETIIDKCPEFKFVSVEYDSFEDDMIFEPIQSPITYIFKDGKRLVCPIGQAPSEEFLKIHNEIVLGVFKTE